MCSSYRYWDVTPVGLNVNDTWHNILAGVSGVTAVEEFDTADYPTKIWAKVRILTLRTMCRSKMLAKWMSSPNTR